MALKASGFGGTSALHELQGLLCDLCGQEADSETTEVVALDCSFAKCPPNSGLYHQACLEKYLKSIKCERNRKIGFPCPRGCGKATKYTTACPGKILKSHPISIRGEANKKRRQAELESLQRSNSNDKDAASQPKAAKKGNGGGEDSKLSRSQSGISSSPSEPGKGGKAVAKNASIKALNVSSTKLTPASSTSSMSTAATAPKSAAAAKKEALAAAARNLKNEIAARTGGATKGSVLQSAASSGASTIAVHVSKTKEVKTLDEYLAERHCSSGALDRSVSSASGASLPVAPATNAWAVKSRASSASSLATEPAPHGEAALDSEAFPPAPPAASRPPVPLPRAPSNAAAAAGAAAVPAPVQPPPPRGAWAQKQPAVLSIVPPPPPPPRDSVATAAAQVPPKPPAVVTLAAQQEEAALRLQQQQEQPKLSKSQRKNLRRAEKKAAAAAAGHASHDAGDASSHDGSPSSAALSPSPTAAVPAGYEDVASPLHQQPPHQLLCSQAGPGSEPGGDLLDRCLQLVVQHKLQKQVESLASLGFPPSAALAAVQQHGGNLEGAVTMLMEQATGVYDSGHSLGGGPLPEVDLSEELAFMQALQSKYRLPEGVLESTVVDCNGDLEASARVITEQCGDSTSDVSSSTTAGAELLSGGGSLFDLPPVAHSPQHPAMQQQQQLLQGAGWSYGGETSPYLSGGGAGPSGEIFGESSGAGGGSCLYSAFGFGGFTEAALHAVHGPFNHGSGGGSGGMTSLFSSLDSSSLGGLTPRHAPLGSQPGLQGSRLGLWAEPASPQWGLPASESSMYSHLSAAGHGPQPPHFGGANEPSVHHRTLSPFDRQPLTMSPPAARPPAAYPAHAPLVADDGPGNGLFGRGGLEAHQPSWPAAHHWGASPGGGMYGGGAADSGYYGGGMGALPAHQGQVGGLVQQSLPHGAGGPQHPGRLLEERELSELMSALLCR